MADWKTQTTKARTWFESLRDQICLEFETIEREAGSEARFEYTPWSREEEETQTQGRCPRVDEGEDIRKSRGQCIHR